MNQIDFTVDRVLRKLGLRHREIISGKNFKDELGLDSIEIIYMANLFEIKLDISIPDNDIAQFVNKESTVQYLSRKIS